MFSFFSEEVTRMFSIKFIYYWSILNLKPICIDNNYEVNIFYDESYDNEVSK